MFLIVLLQVAINFLVRFGASLAVLFLQHAGELTALAPDAIKVAVGEFAPPRTTSLKPPLEK